MQLHKAFILFITINIHFIYGCTSTPPVDYINDAEFKTVMTDEEKSLIRNPQWGLALSGWGIRSAAFQLGVLKYLYNQNNSSQMGYPSLNDIDLISSVSGGGYTSHLLYTTYDRENKGKYDFGYFILDDEHFSESICNVYTRGNFVVYPYLLWNWLPPSSTSPKKYYEQQIRRTFGYKDMPETYQLYMEDLVPYLSDPKQKIPYPIINLTIDGQNKWRYKLFEITPLHEGNDVIGYVPLTHKKTTFSRSVTISAAAIENLLEQEIDNPNPNLGGYESTLTVYDGGKSENMGAVALIRRGIPNIIVSDAEHDPTMGYGGYHVLLDGIQGAGYTVSHFKTNEKSQGFLHFSVSKNGIKQSDVYYIKMQLPTEIFSQERNTAFGYSASEQIVERVKYESCSSAKNEFDNVFGATDFEDPYEEWLKYASLDYKYFLNDSDSLYASWIRTKIKLLNLLTVKSSFFEYSFPHISTADQGLYIDQTLALMGLGYQQANKLMPYIASHQVSGR